MAIVTEKNNNLLFDDLIFQQQIIMFLGLTCMLFLFFNLKKVTKTMPLSAENLKHLDYGFIPREGSESSTGTVVINDIPAELSDRPTIVSLLQPAS